MLIIKNLQRRLGLQSTLKWYLTFMLKQHGFIILQSEPEPFSQHLKLSFRFFQISTIDFSSHGISGMAQARQ